MAGDIGYDERLVVVRPAARRSVAARVVGDVSAAAGVVHQYGDRVMIVQSAGSAGDVPSPEEAAMAARPAELADDDLGDLSAIERLGVDAFELRASDRYATAKAARPHDGAGWNGRNRLPPDAPPEVRRQLPELAAARLAAGAATPTSARLTGSVAVGIVIVQGPGAVLKFTADEQVKVVAEVQNGLGWLGAQSSPAGVRFVYDVHTITLRVRPGGDDLDAGQKEARWRDPAMASLGFGAGLDGVQDYVEQLRASKGTDWAYSAFFTKYPVGWFAYASIGGPRLVMDYANDGWGPDNIDRVFAHETGHIFGAPDEYASSGCTCGGAWGFFGKPNENCETCAAGGGVSCLMRANEFAMCPWTPYHLGFPQGVRYSGAFLEAPPGSHGLWVNADQEHFLEKWREWSEQGLRLRDLDVCRSGDITLYGGVFESGSGGHGLWLDASWNSFRDKWVDWSGGGLRLVDLAVVRVNGVMRYSGVFRTGSGGYALWADASWNSFRERWTQWSGRGLRLVDLAVVDGGAGLRYSGVFAAGRGGYGLWVNASWDSFAAKWQEWSAGGLRLIDLEVIDVDGEVRYSGVFGAGRERHGLWADADWPSFKAKWEEWSNDGLRLIDLAVRPTGIESLAAASPEGGAGRLGHGSRSVGLVPIVPSASGFGALSTDAMDSAQAAAPAEAGFGGASFAATAEAADTADGAGSAVTDRDAAGLITGAGAADGVGEAAT